MKEFRFFFESRDVIVKGEFVESGYEYLRVIVLNSAGGKMTVAAFARSNCLGYMEVTR